jgi:hypothetical protein
MHQLQCQASQPHFRVGSLPEKTSVARLRPEKVYDLRLENGIGTSQVSVSEENILKPGIIIALKVIFDTETYGLASIRKLRDKFHAPRGFCSKRNHFSCWQGNRGVARRRTLVPPRGWVDGLSRSEIEPPEASSATARISTLREAWRSHRPGAEKDPFRMENSFTFGCMRPDRFYVCLCRSMEINQIVPGDFSPVVLLC